jgi:hypothetical protein
MSDKIAEIRARHQRGMKGLTQTHHDRSWLLAEVERLTRERDEALAEVERLREVLEVVRIDGPDAQSLVWLSFSREGGVRVSFVVGHKERMVSQALLEFEQIRRKALETKP